VKLPHGTRAPKLTRSKHPDKPQPAHRALLGAEALQAEFSASQHIVSVSEYDATTPEVLEAEVLENERFLPLRGFKASHLLLMDPKRRASIFPCSIELIKLHCDFWLWYVCLTLVLHFCKAAR
jgi:hypothetical protein